MEGAAIEVKLTGQLEGPRYVARRFRLAVFVQSATYMYLSSYRKHFLKAKCTTVLGKLRKVNL